MATESWSNSSSDSELTAAIDLVPFPVLAGVQCAHVLGTIGRCC